MKRKSHNEPAGSNDDTAAGSHHHYGGDSDAEDRQPIVAKVGKVILSVDHDTGQPGKAESIADFLTAAANRLPTNHALLKAIADWLVNSPVFVEVRDQVVRLHAPAELIDDLVAKGVVELDEPFEGETIDDEEWEPLGSVTIDTASLLLVDPMHTEHAIEGHGEFSLGPNRTGVITDTGMGDGRYLVEGRYGDCPFGRRLAEIRVCFLDEEGNWLGGDTSDDELDAPESPEDASPKTT